MTLEAEAKRYAYRRLAMRSHHSLEMREALAKREYPLEIIDPIVSEMIQAGYLNDADWVANYVRRLQGQRYGPRTIKMKLRAKGITEEEAEPYLEEASDFKCQEAQILSLLTGRYKSGISLIIKKNKRLRLLWSAKDLKCLLFFRAWKNFAVQSSNS